MNCRADLGLHQSAAGARGDRKTLGDDDLGVLTAETLDDDDDVGVCADRSSTMIIEPTLE